MVLWEPRNFPFCGPVFLPGSSILSRQRAVKGRAGGLPARGLQVAGLGVVLSVLLTFQWPDLRQVAAMKAGKRGRAGYPGERGRGAGFGEEHSWPSSPQSLK